MVDLAHHRTDNEGEGDNKCRCGAGVTESPLGGVRNTSVRSPAAQNTGNTVSQRKFQALLLLKVPRGGSGLQPGLWTPSGGESARQNVGADPGLFATWLV